MTGFTFGAGVFVGMVLPLLFVYACHGEVQRELRISQELRAAIEATRSKRGRGLQPGDPIHGTRSLAGISGDLARALLAAYTGDDPAVIRELQFRAGAP